MLTDRILCPHSLPGLASLLQEVSTYPLTSSAGFCFLTEREIAMQIVDKNPLPDRAYILTFINLYGGLIFCLLYSQGN